MFSIDTISVKELDRYREQENVMIIDLRDKKTFKENHFDGAVNIPYKELERCRRISRQNLLILYCERGGTSLFAARELMKMGFRVKSVVGGIRAYTGSNLYFSNNDSKIR